MQFKYLNTIPEEPDLEWFSQAYDAVAARLEALGPDAPTAAWLDMVGHWNELKMVVSGERARVNWGESLDVNDEEAAAKAKTFHGKIRPLATERNAQIRRAVLDGPATDAIRERYGALLIDLWECDEIAANPVNIELDVADRDLATRYHTLRGKAEIEFEGKTHTLTALEKMLESRDDENTRQGAFEAIMGWYRENREELDSIYLELVRLRDQAGRNLDFDNFTPLGYKRMHRLDYGPEQAAQFRSQVLQHVTPLVSRLRAEQAKLLKTEGVMPWNRLYLPQYSLPENVAPVETQLDGALEIYHRLHPKLEAHFQAMIDGGLIDLENRPGKRGGAFCTSIPDRSEVRIFCNSTGSASDVLTLLHESGHAFQGWESQWIAANELRLPSLEACEIHSMGMEYLAYPHLGIFFTPEHEYRFKQGHLVEAMQFLCYACVVDGFQHAVYASPGMNAGQLADSWRDLWDQFMVGENWGDYREELGTYWHHKLHIFARPFYYIDYALALLCALQLWCLSTRDPAEALERYLHLCHLGGTRSFADLVRTAGLADPFAEQTLVDVLTTAREYMGE